MYKNIFLLISLIIIMNTACSWKLGLPSREEAGAPKKPSATSTFSEGQVIEGTASYYGSDHHGRRTASGEIFDMNGLSAAHPAFPFGTLIEVENLNNGQKVQVTINDRGPFEGQRILDLSYGAAKAVHMIKSGLAPVRITILKLPE